MKTITIRKVTDEAAKDLAVLAANKGMSREALIREILSHPKLRLTLNELLDYNLFSRVCPIYKNW